MNMTTLTALYDSRADARTATRDEAIVARTAHATEELVINKTAVDRIETMRDAVRSTRAELENDVVVTGATTTTTLLGFVPPRR